MPRVSFVVDAGKPEAGKLNAFFRGLLTNLLAPKNWVFYIRFLTLFARQGAAGAGYSFPVMRSRRADARLVRRIDRSHHAARARPAVLWIDGGVGTATGDVLMAFGEACRLVIASIGRLQPVRQARCRPLIPLCPTASTLIAVRRTSPTPKPG